MKINLSDPAVAVALGLIVVFVVLVGASVWRRFTGPGPFVRGPQIALIEEESEPSALGNICVGLIMLTAVGCVMLYSAATTIFQQLTAGVLFIGCSIVFGVGVIVGRRRRYRVFRARQDGE